MKKPTMTYKYHTVEGETSEKVTEQPLTLKQQQELVGGYIEMVWVGQPYNSNCLMTNEEGKIHGLPRNPKYPQLVGNIIKGKLAKVKTVTTL